MNILELGFQKGQELGQEIGQAKGQAIGQAKGQAIGQAYAIIEISKELGEVPQDMQDRINEEQDLAVLGQWLKLAIKSKSIEEFQVKSDAVYKKITE